MQARTVLGIEPHPSSIRLSVMVNPIRSPESHDCTIVILFICFCMQDENEATQKVLAIAMGQNHRRRWVRTFSCSHHARYPTLWHLVLNYRRHMKKKSIVMVYVIAWGIAVVQLSIFLLFQLTLESCKYYLLDCLGRDVLPRGAWVISRH